MSKMPKQQADAWNQAFLRVSQAARGASVACGHRGMDMLVAFVLARVGLAGSHLQCGRTELVAARPHEDVLVRFRTLFDAQIAALAEEGMLSDAVGRVRDAVGRAARPLRHAPKHKRPSVSAILPAYVRRIEEQGWGALGDLAEIACTFRWSKTALDRALARGLARADDEEKELVALWLNLTRTQRQRLFGILDAWRR